MSGEAARTLSVGICAHNEEETIGTLLEQVFAEDVPLAEVVVAVAGDDGTADIVREKQQTHDCLVLIEEGEREGQAAAQNKIFAEVTGDLFMFLDADGVIEEGSIERIYEEYDGESILHGREEPITEDSLMGGMIEMIWGIHHDVCMERPKFTTQIGLVPSELVEPMPETIVQDDEFIASRAMAEGYDVKYVPAAVKRHRTSHEFLPYFAQRKKNWAGLLQLREMGVKQESYLVPRFRTFLQRLKSSGPRDLLRLAAATLVEGCAVAGAFIDHITSDYPYKWRR